MIYIANGNDLGEANLYVSTSFLFKANIEKGRKKEGKRGKKGKWSGENNRKYFFSTLNVKPQNKVGESSLLMHMFMKAVQNV